MATTVVIFSGGPDSTAAALWAIANDRDIELLTFQFGHEDQYGEIKAAIGVASHLDRPHHIIDFKSPMHAFGGPVQILMHGANRSADTSNDVRQLPFGAGIVLSIAASFALLRGIHEIVWGATCDDGASNGEYTPSFARTLAAVIADATGDELGIVVPFGETHKAELLTNFRGKEGLFALTWSCKIGGVVQCGLCSACVARRSAASIAGLTDRTVYRSEEFENPLAAFAARDIATLSDDDWSVISPLNKSPKESTPTFPDA